jgi:hypothetical protein
MFHRRRFVPLAALVAAFILVSGLMIGFGGHSTAAQEEEESHPAHIHSGTCGDNLGPVVYPLDNVGGGTMMGTPVTGQQMGASDAIPVQTSTTVVNTTLDDLVGEAYAINVHESQDNITNYIACGNIGGEVAGDSLAIGLAELNGSGYSGIAWLHDPGSQPGGQHEWWRDRAGDQHPGFRVRSANTRDSGRHNRDLVQSGFSAAHGDR